MGYTGGKRPVSCQIMDLYPKYITDLGSFSCPEIRVKILQPEDIDSLAGYVLFKVMYGRSAELTRLDG